MTIELWSLLLLAIALPVTAVVAAGLYGREVGNKTLLGNREALPAPTGVAGRARRAHANLLENLVPFAAVVLIAAQLGISNAWTQGGAVVFLGARLVHYLSYLGDIVGVRSLAFHAGTVGLLIVAFQIVA